METKSTEDEFGWCEVRSVGSHRVICAKFPSVSGDGRVRIGEISSCALHLSLHGFVQRTEDDMVFLFLVDPDPEKAQALFSQLPDCNCAAFVREIHQPESVWPRDEELDSLAHAHMYTPFKRVKTHHLAPKRGSSGERTRTKHSFSHAGGSSSYEEARANEYHASTLLAQYMIREAELREATARREAELREAERREAQKREAELREAQKREAELREAAARREKRGMFISMVLDAYADRFSEVLGEMTGVVGREMLRESDIGEECARAIKRFWSVPDTLRAVLSSILECKEM